MKIQGLILCSSLLCLAACGGGGSGNSSSGDHGDSASSSSSSSTSSSSSSGDSEEEFAVGALSVELLSGGRTFLVQGSSQSEEEGLTLRLPASDDEVTVTGITVNGESLDLPSDDEAMGSGMFHILEADSESREIFAPLDPGSNEITVTMSDGSTTTTSLINEGLFGGSDTGNIMLDTDGNRMLIIESNRIFEVDLSTHYRRMLRNPEGDPLSIERIGAYRPSGNQIFYLDYVEFPESPPIVTLRRLDLDTGVDEEISCLSHAGILGEGPVLDGFTDIAYGPSTDQVYVLGASDLDAGYDLVISVDLTTGNRSLLTASGTVFNEGTGDLFYGMGSIAWNSATDHLLAAGHSGLFDIDASNGNRTKITGYNPTVGSGADFGMVNPASLAYDSVHNQALFVAMMPDAEMNYGLFSVDMDNGERTLVSNMRQRGAGPGFYEQGVRGLTVSPDGEKAYAVVDNLYSLLEIDLDTGDRRTYSSEVGTGPRLVRPQHSRFDEAGRRLLVTDRLIPALLAVDVDTGERSIISGAGTGGGTAFDSPTAVDINAAGTLAYVLDEELDCIFEVDLNTGDRTIISGNGFGIGLPALEVDFGQVLTEFVPPDMVLDEAHERLLVMRRNSILAVNVSTGERSIVASNLTDADRDPGVMALEIDRPGNRLYIAVVKVELAPSGVDVFKSAILEMDLNTDDIQDLIPFGGVPEYMHFHDLALNPDGNTLYVMNNREMRELYTVDLVARQMTEGTNVLQHRFSNQLTTIETGPTNNTVYMFDQMSGAVMLMQIDRIFGSTHVHEYEGVVISQ